MKIPGKAEIALPDIMVYLKYEADYVCFARLNPLNYQDINSEPKWVALCPEKGINKVKKD